MARQNLTTLVADVPQARASSEMLRQATPCGSSRTACATRRSTGARFGSSDLMVTRIPTSAPGSDRACCSATRPDYLFLLLNPWWSDVYRCTGKRVDPFWAVKSSLEQNGAI